MPAPGRAAGALQDGDPPLFYPPESPHQSRVLPRNRDILLCPPHGGAKGSREGRDPHEGLRAFRPHPRCCSVPPRACWPRWLGDTSPVGCAAADGPALLPFSLQQGKSSSTGNLLDKDDIAIPPPDYGMSSQAFPSQNVNTFKQRPYSVAVPAFSQVSPDCLQGFASAGGGFFLKNGRRLSEPQSLDLCWSLQLFVPSRGFKAEGKASKRARGAERVAVNGGSSPTGLCSLFVGLPYALWLCN